MSEEDVRKEIQRLNDLYIKEIDKKIVYSKEVVDCLIDAKTNKLQQENKQLKEKINTYENPEDLTLMFMYCDEKAKDKIKQLKEVIEKVREYIETQKKKPYKSLSEKATICNKYNDLLQILDKVKGE